MCGNDVHSAWTIEMRAMQLGLVLLGEMPKGALEFRTPIGVQTIVG